MKEGNTEQVFAFIAQHIEQEGFSPTIREISAACYLGRSSVVRHLDKLEKWGWLQRHEGKARSIVITRQEKRDKNTDK
ncbi:MAG: MarR family transcriptional regulator [Chloroflexota bacterium]|nr:MarR family transcriptional regulator [Chloroflexota bacterium]